MKEDGPYDNTVYRCIFPLKSLCTDIFIVGRITGLRMNLSVYQEI